MSKILIISIQLVAAAILWQWTSSPSLAAEPAIHISGAVTRPSDWSADQIKTQMTADLATIQFTSQSRQHSARAIPLLALLQKAGATVAVGMNPTAPAQDKNLPLRMAVVVKGRDGYTVVFSLAELLPDIGNEKVWVVLEADGAAISDTDGPIRLVVPGDTKPGRWVHQLASIEIRDLATPPAEPAH